MPKNNQSKYLKFSLRYHIPDLLEWLAQFEPLPTNIQKYYASLKCGQIENLSTESYRAFCDEFNVRHENPVILAEIIAYAVLKLNREDLPILFSKLAQIAENESYRDLEIAVARELPLEDVVENFGTRLARDSIV